MRRVLLAGVLLAVLGPSLAGQSASDLFQKALSKERVDGQLIEAIALYERVVNEFASDRPLVAKALVQTGRCYERLGKADARRAYQRVLQEYSDQKTSAAEARDRLAALDRASNSSATTMTTRRVWNGRDAITEGAPSWDGRYLTTLDPVSNDLAIRDLVTGQTRRLFAKGSGAASTEFAEASLPSPDGTRIVYQWFTKENFYELRTIGLTDRKPRVLYSHPDHYVTPAGWSPDGRRVLAVLGDQGTSRLAWITVADGSVRVLKSLDWRWPNGVRVSPDGRFIVYDFPPSDKEQQRDIFVLHADGSSESKLVAHAANDVQPIFAPDNETVLFTSDRTGVNSLWMIKVGNGKPQGAPALLKSDVGRSLPLGFTRNGAYYYGVYMGGSDVYLVSIDPASYRLTTEPALMTNRFVGANLSPDWSPDGKSVLFITQRGSAFGLSVDAGHLALRFESGEQRDVTTPLRRFYRPRWARDGRTIVVAATDPNGKSGWYRLDPKTGDYERLRLMDDEASIDELEWSADGRSVFYHARDNAGSRVVRQSLVNDDTQILCRAPATWDLSGLSASPDGRHLAFRTVDPASGAVILNALPTAGGSVIELLRLGSNESIPASYTGSAVTWTTAGDAVLFVKRRAVGNQIKSEAWKVSVASRAAEPLGISMPGLGSIRVRPDGSALALTAGSRSSEVWVMENFLPPSAQTTTSVNPKRSK